MAWVNEELARRFNEIAHLLDLTGADRFRVRAYERAASVLGTAPVDLASLPRAALKDLKGVGETTAKRVVEYLDTGEIGMLTELRAKVPPGVVELTRVPGIGPKLALQLSQAGVESVATLRERLEAGTLVGLPGLGEKTAANLRDALGRMGAKEDGRTPAADAIAMAEEFVAQLAALPQVEAATYAGSLRRMRETIGDLDFLAASADPIAVHEAFRALPPVVHVLAAGGKKSSVLTVRGIQADLRVVEPDAYGAALQYFTGSKAHNVRTRERAVRRKLLLNEYGLFHRTEDGGQGERIAARSEDDVYAALGLQYIPPTLREDHGEVDAAAAGTLPQVVTATDIRGDLHGHSHFSGDGKHTLEQMVEAAAARGYSYWAVTDHAENLTMNGMSREVIAQRRGAIAELQERCDLRILQGLELNIAMDGTVDYDPELLATMDWNVASIHSHMRYGSAEQTARTLTAIANPHVHAIGHPTGRKIGVRPGYEIDLAAILEACRETGTALEVNASPRRLDLSGEMVRRAVEAGVTLTISCDAHSVGDLASLRYGVWTAQRGWATPADVLNTRSLAQLEAFVEAKRARG